MRANVLLFEERGDRHAQGFAALVSFRGRYFEKEPPILANQRNTPDFPAAEKTTVWHEFTRKS
jgi:hypothetical protein